MIALSLLAVALAVSFLFHYLQDSHASRIRAQGTSLARVLSTVPLTELIQDGRPAVLMRALNVSENREDFAYASVVDRAATTLGEVAAAGVLVPSFTAAGQSGLGEIRHAATHATAAVLEFQSPVFDGGELAGTLRLGYFAPGLGPTAEQLPFVATVALIIFALTPFYYFLVRREIRPLASANARLGDLLENGEVNTLQVAATGELGEFMGRFNAFVNFAGSRIRELESDRERVITSTRLLSYRKERIVRVLESLPDAVMVMDDGGTITFVNGRFSSLFDVEATTVTGSASLEWCTQDQTRRFLEACGGHSFLPEPLEFEPERTPGKTLQMSAYPQFAPGDNNVIGCLVIVRDVTMEKLARSGRAEFVAHVAHELKTPLNVLSMYSETLQSEDAEDAALRIEAANVIFDEVERLSLLINNLLSLTRLEMGSLDADKQRVRIRDLLEDVFRTVEHARGADELTFDLDLPQQMTALSLDKDLMRIAFNNLLTNAIKYNRPGGTVTLAATETDEAVRVAVRDTGIGIAPADQAQVFDKFFRSDENEVRERTGHGLGLALARDIVQLHHGTISVSSTPGEGTEFVIELLKQAHDMRKAV